MNTPLDKVNVGDCCPAEDYFASVGDTVFDILTGTQAKIVKLEADEAGNVGIWINNDYLEGGRHPWEVGRPLES